MSRIGLACRYGFVSGVCLLLHNVIVIAGDNQQQSLPLAMSESFCVVVVAGFLLHCRFTFAATPTWPAFLRYTAAMAMNVPASLAVLWFFARLLAWHMTLAAPVATCTMIALNFVASRWAIHRDRAVGSESAAC